MISFDLFFGWPFQPFIQQLLHSICQIICRTLYLHGHCTGPPGSMMAMLSLFYMETLHYCSPHPCHSTKTGGSHVCHFHKTHEKRRCFQIKTAPLKIYSIFLSFQILHSFETARYGFWSPSFHKWKQYNAAAYGGK